MEEMAFIGSVFATPNHQAQQLLEQQAQTQEIHAMRQWTPEEWKALEALYTQQSTDWTQSPVVQWMVLTAGVGLIQELSGDHARSEDDDERDDEVVPKDRQPAE